MGDDKATNARGQRQIKVVKSRQFQEELAKQMPMYGEPYGRYYLSLEKRRQRKANRQANDPRKARRKAQLRCFWTWPWGHVYDQGRCVGCGVGKPMNL